MVINYIHFPVSIIESHLFTLCRVTLEHQTLKTHNQVASGSYMVTHMRLRRSQPLNGSTMIRVTEIRPDPPQRTARTYGVCIR